MLLMLAEVLRSCVIAAAVPDSMMWRLVCGQQTHAAWTGLTLHDLIQPGFYFLVGAGLLFSLSRRRATGESAPATALHVILRSLLLVVLGMAVVSMHPREWKWVFTDTLSQIGLAYPFLFLIARQRRRAWVGALVLILVGYWLLFAVSPPAPTDFDYSAVGVTPDWLHAHGLTGFESRWQKNSNVAVQFDRWFLAFFPRNASAGSDSTGLATLNFIPSIGTMLLGVIGANVLTLAVSPLRKLERLTVMGAALLASGLILGQSGICPVVKAIWTPSWILVSGGCCFLLLAAFYAVVDVLQYRSLAFPLIVIGTNSLIAYLMSHIYPAFAFNALERIVGRGPFHAFGVRYEPLVYGASVMLGYWLVLFLLHRRRIFVRI